jgi:2-polyprenyl-3-methyl-5-hydroxy-6-metoxy-1,4-benzoquinol methylase
MIPKQTYIHRAYNSIKIKKFYQGNTQAQVNLLLSMLDYALKYFQIKRELNCPDSLIAKSLYLSIEDAKEYLDINTDQFFQYANMWADVESKLFEEKDSIAAFYENWKDDVSKFNICANILNQHLDVTSFKALYTYFAAEKIGKGTLIDYGCGTGTLSFAFAIENATASYFLLIDVDNDIKNFIQFRIKKHKLCDNVFFENANSFNKFNYASGLYCIDVLEHLENASNVLINKIHPCLKLGGLLYLKAPWGGHLTHLEEASNNFYCEGGRKLLRQKYKLVRRLKPLDIAGVYRKIKK